MPHHKQDRGIVSVRNHVDPVDNARLILDFYPFSKYLFGKCIKNKRKRSCDMGMK